MRTYNQNENQCVQVSDASGMRRLLALPYGAAWQILWHDAGAVSPLAGWSAGRPVPGMKFTRAPPEGKTSLLC